MHLDRYWSAVIRHAWGRRSPDMISAKHLAWVRQRPCLVSMLLGGDSAFTHVDAHHVVPRSRGTNDYTAIPLRHPLHMEGHQIGWASFEKKHAVDIKDALIATLIERVWELERGIR